MQDWKKIDRSKDDFKVTLTTGEILMGSFPLENEEKYLGPEMAGFLPWDKKPKLFESLPQGYVKISLERVLRYITPIPFGNILTIKKMEKDLSGISLVGNKPIPVGLTIQLENIAKPGFVKITYQIPGNPKQYEIGELEIINGEISLPLKLAFISYAREDQASVQEIIRQLNDEGILTWFDEKELLPGDHWESKIETAIEKSEYVIVFFSSKTLERSGYKNKEIHYILDQAKYRTLGSRYIIPLLLDECRPPREFKELHWLEHGKDGWLMKLVNALK